MATNRRRHTLRPEKFFTENSSQIHTCFCVYAVQLTPSTCQLPALNASLRKQNHTRASLTVGYADGPLFYELDTCKLFSACIVVTMSKKHMV